MKKATKSLLVALNCPPFLLGNVFLSPPGYSPSFSGMPLLWVYDFHPFHYISIPVTALYIILLLLSQIQKMKSQVQPDWGVWEWERDKWSVVEVSACSRTSIIPNPSWWFPPVWAQDRWTVWSQELHWDKLELPASFQKKRWGLFWVKAWAAGFLNAIGTLLHYEFNL